MCQSFFHTMVVTDKNIQARVSQEISYHAQKHLPPKRSQNLLLHRAKRRLHHLLKGVPYSLVI
jgi:hypothetical protein